MIRIANPLNFNKSKRYKIEKRMQENHKTLIS